MFGEHESESPRVPSPWDLFLPSPPNLSSAAASPQSLPQLENGVPKLAPEIEEGNIEYKLKLTNISNARFARLVTQLKWRLLEGGGQAYYELGVADTGALIGLARADLEASLETLEMMAGEIGASVIVVKEIEVPPAVAALADKDSGYTNPDTGEWTRKMRRRPQLTGGDCSTSATSSTTTEVETETDFSPAEYTDIDDIACSLSTPGIATPAPTSGSAYTAIVHRPIRTNPSRPTAQSSPYIAPLDDDLALFSMEPEPAFASDEHLSISGTTADDEFDTNLGFDLGARRSSYAGLEISAVYKPRPVRHRARATPAPTPGRHGKRLSKPKEKKVHPWHGPGGGATVKRVESELTKEEKAMQRRLARDKKREEKRNALISLASVQTEASISPAASPPDELAAAVDTLGEETDALVHGMEEPHAGVDESPVIEVRPLADDITNTVDVQASEREDAALANGIVKEPRLIVEALVVRKMSIEEATLDFSRLALI
ncbi:hypothetical protein C8Q74DRAFT_1450994 [Fomes fomentarius]|nr:hypothetical protein C8Q74DRAFT_1450994 [Fomes fomentarius]